MQFIKILIFLSIGTALMLIPMLILAGWSQMKRWKAVPAALIVTVAGTVGAYLWFYMENKWFGGTSFFGAVYLVPVAFLLCYKLFGESYGALMDLCAPAGCVMLAIMKIQCCLSGCCAGKELFVTSAGVPVYFPSQIAESVNALLILAAIMALAHRKKCSSVLYACFLIFYGVTRFILNFFRAEQLDFFMGMSAGHVWSLLAVILGTIWLVLYLCNPGREKGSAGALSQ